MLSTKVIDVVPLRNHYLLVFFEDGITKKFNVNSLIDKYQEFKELIDDKLFNSVKVEPGGYGISWNDELDCSEGELYSEGISIDIAYDDFILFVQHNLVNTREATEILNCSKQNIDDLIKRNKLKPVKSGSKYNLFLREDICRRTW